MYNKPNRQITKAAQTLRRQVTYEQKRLWYDFLKTLPVTVHRKKPIDVDIVDFYCDSARLVIEVEDIGEAEALAKDTRIKSFGLTVLRYSREDIRLRFDAVCGEIEAYIKHK